MAGGEGDIKTANPPPDLIPGRSAIGAKGKEAEEEAETQPAEEHDECGLQKHRLRLSELLNGVEGEYGRREGQARVVVDAAAQLHAGATLGE